jgi:hypothetical protein
MFQGNDMFLFLLPGARGQEGILLQYNLYQRWVGVLECSNIGFGDEPR